MNTKSSLILIDALAPHVAGASKTRLKSLIAARRVTVDGVVVSHPLKEIKEGQKIVVLAKEKICGPNIKIFYDDPHLVVVYKPENLLTVAQDIGGSPSLHGYLKDHFKKKITPVHRLDKGTSGVLVFAKTEASVEFLKKLFFEHDIVREYIGVVQGVLEPKKGTWIDWLAEDERAYVRTVQISQEGKKAITEYEVIDQNETYSLVRFRLQTGKKHQIRVQASSKGFPLLGDDVYGGSRHSRLMLHALKLEFVHPVTRKLMKFEAPLPPSFSLAKSQGPRYRSKRSNFSS